MNCTVVNRKADGPYYDSHHGAKTSLAPNPSGSGQTIVLNKQPKLDIRVIRQGHPSISNNTSPPRGKELGKDCLSIALSLTRDNAFLDVGITLRVFSFTLEWSFCKHRIILGKERNSTLFFTKSINSSWKIDETKHEGFHTEHRAYTFFL